MRLRRLRLLVADDDSAWRRTLRTVLERGGAEVVGEAGDGAEAVALTRQLTPDVVLLDMAMPGVSGLDAVPDLQRCAPATAVLAVSSSDDPVLVAAALRAGAAGYVVKTAGPAALTRSVARAAAGEHVGAVGGR